MVQPAVLTAVQKSKGQKPTVHPTPVRFPSLGRPDSPFGRSGLNARKNPGISAHHRRSLAASSAVAQDLPADLLDGSPETFTFQGISRLLHQSSSRISSVTLPGCRVPAPKDWPMLVLSRKKDESIVINNDITIVVVEIRGDKVRLGVEAPKEVPVHRREVFEAIARGEPVDANAVGPAGASALSNSTLANSSLANGALANSASSLPGDDSADSAGVVSGELSGGDLPHAS
jgi:carbon storage regulator